MEPTKIHKHSRAFNGDSPKAAFTLTELLVVIVVLAILGAFSISALAGAKNRGLTLSCINNTKQLGMAYAMYLQQYGKSFSFSPTGTWLTELGSELGQSNSPVALCPTATAQPAWTGWWSGGQYGDAAHCWQQVVGGIQSFTNSGSYTLNGYLYSGVPFSLGAPGNGALQITNFAAIPNPAITPVFTDGIWVDGWPQTNSLPSQNLYTGNMIQNGVGRICIGRHGSLTPYTAPSSLPVNTAPPGSINMVFFDGHASLVPLKDIWKQTWNNAWATPNPYPYQ